jgi:ABC-type lipoprotein release transport system permease subunit
MAARAWNLLLAAAENVARNGAGYAVAAAALVLGLTLLLCGVAIGEGLKSEALATVDAGADLYVTADLFGRDAAVAAARAQALAKIDGVVEVVPRVVGRVAVGDRIALVIGVPLARLAARKIALRGALPAAPDQVLLGCELARALGIAPGMRIALESDLLRLFVVSGVVEGGSSLWSAKAIVCDLDEAALLFGESERVSDLCLFVRAGYEARVADAIQRLDPRLRVQTRSLVAAWVERGMTLREGVFTLLFALMLALAIAAFAIVTWFGATPRRREVAVRKSEGWTTSDVLTLVAFENLLVAAAAAGLSLLLALIWVDWLRAPLIAPFFLPDLPLFPTIHVPSRFTPIPALLAFCFSLAVTMSGSILATWRTAVTRPAEVLR